MSSYLVLANVLITTVAIVHTVVLAQVYPNPALAGAEVAKSACLLGYYVSFNLVHSLHCNSLDSRDPFYSYRNFTSSALSA